jgi:hypothetical protein
MAFNCLILTCLINSNSIKDGACSVGIKKIPGEKILFFLVDNLSNPNSCIRNDFKLKGPICDLVIYHQALDKKTICLTELKGHEVFQAVKQIINTKEKFTEKLIQNTKGLKCNRALKNIIWKANIVFHGSAPQQTKKYKTALLAHFKKGNIKIDHGSELGQFIRE